MLLLILGTSTARACTTWGAIGEAVQGGGLLIAKNRDNPPTGLEILKFHQSLKNDLVSYLTLSYKNNTNNKSNYRFISAGVNQYGLVVVNNAAASTLEKNLNHREVGETILIKKILSHFSNVSQVLLCRSQLFNNTEVNHLLIGDSTGLIQVEIGPHGLYAIKHANKSQPYLFHTNTYESKNLVQFNTVDYKDSQIRYARIKTLLKKTKPPFTLNDFWRISYDRNAGENSSLFRDYTEATWIVKETTNASPILYVHFTNPNQHYATYQLKLNKAFWQSGNKKIRPVIYKEKYNQSNQTID